MPNTCLNNSPNLCHNFIWLLKNIGFIENVALGEKDSFGTKVKKNFLVENCLKKVPKESFFIIASDVVPVLCNKPCMYWRLKSNQSNQSNQDWNTNIPLKNNGPHVKVPLVFWFLIMIFYRYYYHQFCVKWVVYISEIVLVILDKIIHASQNICGCLTLNKMQIKLTSLITCLNNNNLTNTSSTPPPEGQKQYCI